MRQKVLLILAGIVLLGLLSALSLLPAIAGTNGQQILFYVHQAIGTGPGIIQMEIAGSDQNGNFSSWFRTYDGEGVTSGTTDSWWWKGPVTLTFFPLGDVRHQCTVEIPPAQSYDFAQIAIDITPDSATCYLTCSWDAEKSQCKE